MRYPSRVENGKVYKIRNWDNDLVYIGSTCNKLYKRLFNHKTSARVAESKPDKAVKFLYRLMSLQGPDRFYIEEVPYKTKCTTMAELVERENELAREIGTINKMKMCGVIKDDGTAYWKHWENMDETVNKNLPLTS